MRVVVLTKPVPDTSGDESFEADLTLDRASLAPVINPNDEYALEAALRLAETMPGTEITLLTMAPAESWAGLSKGLAVGANQAVMVTDPALEGSCIVGTANVLAAALRKLEFDLILAGTDTPDGRAGVVCSAVAALLQIPFISHAGSIDVRDDRVVVSRTRDDGHETLDAPLPAVVAVTQQIGDLRYPNLRGIMAARSRRPTSWSLADLDVAGAAGGAAATTATLHVEPCEIRTPTRVVRGDADAAVHEIVAFLADRRLIP